MFPLTLSPLPLLKNIRKPLIVGVVMMSLLLTLNKLDILFWCFHCYFQQVNAGRPEMKKILKSTYQAKPARTQVYQALTFT